MNRSISQNTPYVASESEVHKQILLLFSLWW